MVKGDVKSASNKRRGTGRTRSYVYDDEGRGRSKSLYEVFERHLTAQSAANRNAWLRGSLDDDVNDEYPTLEHGLYDRFLLGMVDNMTTRYNMHDWAWDKFSDSEYNDGRVRRLVIKCTSLQEWHILQERAKKLWEDRKHDVERDMLARSEEWSQQQAVFEAERIRRLEEQITLAKSQAELVAGTIMSEIDMVFALHDKFGEDDGEWIDDTVALATTGYGFGYEDEQATGVKLQITIALDMSNSMYHNGLADVASDAFRNICIALEMLRNTYDGNVFVAAFEFAHDGYKDGDKGRVAKNLTISRFKADKHVTYDRWGTLQQLSDVSAGSAASYLDSGNSSRNRWRFTGEDTWFYPLFEEIEAWENAYSDPGAYRLDLIITDAVMEHPSDIRRSDNIQTRRDGALQTVMLNFVDPSQWVDSDLPLRCVQYGVNADNVGLILRNVIAEFVGAHM